MMNLPLIARRISVEKRGIRQEPGRFATEIPLLALTARQRHEDARQLAKPGRQLSLESLFTKVCAMVENRRSLRPQSARAK
ncbi:hypothetical protein BHC62_19450 [Pseudomonas sp. 06C 126]|nr:hypothetical protein BHC62_19450 [Pseudomonas sp. 06C 126]